MTRLFNFLTNASFGFWTFVISLVGFLLISRIVSSHSKNASIDLSTHGGKTTLNRAKTQKGFGKGTAWSFKAELAEFQFPPRDPVGAAHFLQLLFWTPIYVWVMKTVYPVTDFRLTVLSFAVETDLVWFFVALVIAVWVLAQAEFPRRFEIIEGLLIAILIAYLAIEVLSTLRPEIFSLFDGAITLRRSLSNSEVLDTIFKYWVSGYEYKAKEYCELKSVYEACRDQLSELAESNRWYTLEEFKEEASRILHDKQKELAELKATSPAPKEPAVVRGSFWSSFKDTVTNLPGNVRSFFTYKNFKRLADRDYD